MDKENVLSKLRKLQRLYEGAKKINSEGEAANAARLIQKLLTQYNLSMDELQVTDESAEKILEESVSGYNFKSIGGAWEQQLMYVICRWNFCKCFTVNGDYKKLVIFGKRENLEVVKWMKGMLSERYVEFSKTRYKEYLEAGMYDRPMSKPTFQRHYLSGCANGLHAKLKEEARKDKAESPEMGERITALVVRNTAAIDEYIASKYHTKKARQRGGFMDAAASAGYRDGKNTQLNRPLTGGKTAVSKTKMIG